MEKKTCQSCFREFEGASCPHCGGAKNDEHQLPVGTVLRDRYKIGKVLGQGGFGITYLGWDSLFQKTVAVKEFYPSGKVFRVNEVSNAVECTTAEMIPHYTYSKERFLREASALVDFKDIPEVVDILDFMEENNTAYIIMEYVKGVELAKYIQLQGGRLTVKETFRILKPVMEALAKVHKSGIVHRDISPDNIILDPAGGAKLLDFGAVRTVENPDVEKGLNKSTEAIIKHGFAPIEQYNTRGSLGPWTDEYAMCATVWYCLTGTIPEEASVRMSEDIDPDWNTIPELPEHQRQALHKGISRRAKDRYESMDHLLEALFPDKKTLKKETAKAQKETKQKEKKAKTSNTKQAGKKKKKKKARPYWIIPAVAAVIALAMVAVPILQDRFAPAEIAVPSTQPPTGTAAPQTQPAETTEVTETTEATLSAEEMMKETDYQMAEQLLAEGKFHRASERFTQLGDYKDSADRVPECHYKWAESLLAEGNFQEAIDKFTQLGVYQDSPTMVNECYYIWAQALEKEGNLADAAILFGKLDTYSDARDQSFRLWDRIAHRDTISAGYQHSAGVRSDGTVVTVGRGGTGTEKWTDIIAVSARNSFTVGLRSNGTVVSTSSYTVGTWKDIVSISAGNYFVVGLKSDGTVASTNQNYLDNWTDIMAIAAGYGHVVGLKTDGTVVAIGDNGSGQCDVSKWTDIVAISAGDEHTVGLKSDGTVVATGSNYEGQCNVTKWTGIVTISAGCEHTMGAKADGTAVATGLNNDGQCNVKHWADIVAFAPGYRHSLGLMKDGTVAAIGYNEYGQRNTLAWTGWSEIPIPKRPLPFQ